MTSTHTVDGYVREFIANRRNAHGKAYNMSWMDMEELFRGKIDNRVGQRIWQSTHRFEWLVDDVSIDQTLDFVPEKGRSACNDKTFIVNIAICRDNDDMTHTVLSMGAGTEMYSQNLFLSSYRQNDTLIWRCQICIKRRENDGVGGEWQAGTIFVRGCDTTTQIIQGFQMKSMNAGIIDQMMFNGNIRTPKFAFDQFQEDWTLNFFYWSDANEAIWNGAICLHTDDNQYNCLDSSWYESFKTQWLHTFMKGVTTDNPFNQCSIKLQH